MLLGDNHSSLPEQIILRLFYCDKVRRIVIPNAVLEFGYDVDTTGVLIVFSKNNLTFNRSLTV